MTTNIISNKSTIISAFDINDLQLVKPILYNDQIQCKFKNKPIITINNATLIKNKNNSKNIYNLNCIANLELQNFLLTLQNKLEDLFSQFLDQDNSPNIEPLIRFNSNSQIIFKIYFNKLLKLVEDLDFNNKYNLYLELYSIIQDGNNIKIIWKLKSLEVIEISQEQLIAQEDIDILNHKIFEIRNDIISKSHFELNTIKEKFNKLEKIYNQMLSENNIDNLKNLRQQFIH